MTTIGSSASRFSKRIFNSPNRVRLSGAVEAVETMIAMQIEGYFRVWFNIATSFELALMQVRNKDDSLNEILSLSATSGLLALGIAMRPRGLVTAARSIVVGGVSIVFIDVLRDAMNYGQQNEPTTTRRSQFVPESSFASEAGLMSRFGKFRFCRAYEPV